MAVNRTPLTGYNFLAAPRAVRMDAFDALPRKLRDLLNEYPVNISPIWASKAPNAVQILTTRRSELRGSSLENMGIA